MSADEEYKKIIADANSRAKSLIEEANKKAQAEKEPILQKAREASNKITNINKSDVNIIINNLTERIVEDGNS